MQPRLPPPLPDHRAIKVRVVAPSGTLIGHEERFETGLNVLRSYGFEVDVPEGITQRSYRRYLSAPDAHRRSELLDALSDDSADLVWCARGGSGAGRLLPELLSEVKLLKPKWLIGFSDATSLLNALAIECGWVTIHGPTITLLNQHSQAPSEIRSLCNNINNLSPSDTPTYGGNLTVLSSLMGTLDLSQLSAHHLLIEDVNEHPYRLDRCLTQLRQNWPVSKIKSIWLGDLDLPKAATHDVILNMYEDFQCPIVTGVPAGHSGAFFPIPLGYGLPDNFLNEILETDHD